MCYTAHHPVCRNTSRSCCVFPHAQTHAHTQKATLAFGLLPKGVVPLFWGCFHESRPFRGFAGPPGRPVRRRTSSRYRSSTGCVNPAPQPPRDTRPPSCNRAAAGTHSRHPPQAITAGADACVSRQHLAAVTILIGAAAGSRCQYIGGRTAGKTAGAPGPFLKKHCRSDVPRPPAPLPHKPALKAT